MIGLTVAMFYENVTIQFSIDVLVKPRLSYLVARGGVAKKKEGK